MGRGGEKASGLRWWWFLLLTEVRLWFWQDAVDARMESRPAGYWRPHWRSLYHWEGSLGGIVESEVELVS